MSSMSLTNQASIASWIANNAVAWKRRSTLKSCVTSLTSLATHNFLHNNSVLFWYLLICWSATVPWRYLQGFLMAPVNVLPLPLDFLSDLVGNCFCGAFPATFCFGSEPLALFSLLHHHQIMVISWQPLLTMM